jgi:hypothetical protein
MLGHIVNNLLNGYVDIIFDYSLIYISNDALNYTELLKQLTTGIENLLRENILFTVHPQIWKSLLGRIENLSQVAQSAFFVKNFVRFGELFTIVSRSATCFVDFAKPFDLIEEPFAGSLTVLRI